MPLINPSSGGFVNPMTSAGDLIIGGSSGAATRLAKGSTGQVLTVSSGGTLDYETPTGGSSPLLGCFLRSSTSQTIPATTYTFINWPTKDYDTAALYSAGTPNLITIPSGANYCRVVANVYVDAASSGSVNGSIIQNYYGGGSIRRCAYNLASAYGFTDRYLPLVTGYFRVSTGDTVQIRMYCGNSTIINTSTEGSSFYVEIRG